MIPYIDERLREWATWSCMRLDGYYGIGGSQFDYEDHPHGVTSAVRKRPVDWRCIETEEGVAWLRLENRGIGDCVLIHYRDHPEWSAEIQAHFLRMSLRTYWRRLETANGLLLGYFLDRAVGLMPQTEALRLARATRIAG